jgi:glycerol kinase
MTALLALDQGTTSSRALVFGEEGALLGMAQRELRQIFPRPGWVEHDPVEIWESQLAVAREALAKAGRAAREVAALGIANQRETVVLWERATGRPLANAIVWQDRRTAPACARLRAAGHEELFAARTGLTLDPYFSGTKLAWLLDEIPGARQAAEAGRLAAGTVDAWLVWNLTGGAVHATDATNASRTLLYDLASGGWDAELAALLDTPLALLPEIRPSGALYGETAAGLFDSAIPIAGVLGDQQAALFGQACFAPGMAKTTYGTGAFLLVNTGARPVRSAHGLLASPAWRLPGTAGQPGRTEFALEGSVFVAGAAVQWLRDGLKLIGAAAEIEALAANVPDSGGVHLVPAFTGLGAPHWDPAARGALLGLTRGTTAAHVARATLEGIAHQVADVLEAMESDGVPLAELRVDGGAAANDLLLQIQADLAGLPVARPRVRETTALGAAYMAGLTAGAFSDREEIAAHWKLDRRFEPAIGEDERRERRARWAKAVAAARAAT